MRVKYYMRKLILFTLLLFSFAGVVEAKHKHKHKNHVHKQVKQKKHKSYISTNTSWILMNVTDNAVVVDNFGDHKASIASISKLMTVYTVLNANQNLDEILSVQTRLGNHTRLSPGMKLSREDLIKLALIHSDNLAAHTLAENYPGGYDKFIYAMNVNAKNMLMENTVFHDPTGLDAGNRSTMKDIIFLTNAASQFPLVREAAQSDKVVVSANKNQRTYVISARPTSTFFGKEGIVTIKTGFTNAAGFCITMLISKENKLYNLVILGARSSQERKRIIERTLSTIKFT
jgi:D-alanyl-D-alanine endopeptidase (penicillin-binding protein 7)